jgi:hypothetical protein
MSEGKRHDYRLFNNIMDAFDHVRNTVGTDVITDEYHIYNKDKTVKINVAGCDITDLLGDSNGIESQNVGPS